MSIPLPQHRQHPHNHAHCVARCPPVCLPFELEAPHQVTSAGPLGHPPRPCKGPWGSWWHAQPSPRSPATELRPHGTTQASMIPGQAPKNAALLGGWGSVVCDLVHYWHRQPKPSPVVQSQAAGRRWGVSPNATLRAAWFGRWTQPMPIRSCAVHLPPFPLFSPFLSLLLPPYPSPNIPREFLSRPPMGSNACRGQPPGGSHSVSLPNLAYVPLIIDKRVHLASLFLRFSLSSLLFQPVCALPRFPPPYLGMCRPC